MDCSEKIMGQTKKGVSMPNPNKGKGAKKSEEAQIGKTVTASSPKRPNRQCTIINV